MSKKTVAYLLMAVFCLSLISIAPITANAVVIDLPGSPVIYNAIPFSYSFFGSGRYQQVYDSSIFPQKGFISSVAFCPEYTGTYGANIEISIGYTSVPVGYLSTNLDTNVTGQSKVVFSDSSFSQAVTAGWNYSLVFDFSSPKKILYQPNKGNLLIDIVISDQISSMGALRTGPGLSSRAWNTSNIIGNGNDTDTGAPPAALLTRFQFTPVSASVPEPSTLLLLASGLVGLAGLGRRKFRK